MPPCTTRPPAPPRPRATSSATSPTPGASTSAGTVGLALGRTRQSLHAQYVDNQPGWSSLSGPQPDAINADASLHIHGPSTASVHLTTPTGSHTYNARTRTWTTSAQPDPALNLQVRAYLKSAAVAGQQTAGSRHAGIAKRLKTIKDNDIKIGRPRKR